MEIRVNVERAIRYYLYSIEDGRNNILNLWDILDLHFSFNIEKKLNNMAIEAVNIASNNPLEFETVINNFAEKIYNIVLQEIEAQANCNPIQNKVISYTDTI